VKIKVLGSGCSKCNKLYSEVESAIASSGVEVDLEKVEAIEEIIRYGVMLLPALVVNEDVKSSGCVPQSSEILLWITSASKIS